MSKCKCGCGCQNGCYNPCACPDASSNIYPVSGAVVVQNSWNIPACGANATLNVPGLKSAVVGYYLGNPTYGFYKIISFDAVLGQVIVQNTCLEGNAAPGTVVPAFTSFYAESNLVEQILSPWVDFASTFGALTSSGSAPTGVTVTEAKYKESDYDLVDFYAEISEFTIVGTPQYIYAPLPIPAKNTIYQGNFYLYMEDSGGALENAYVDVYTTTSLLRFQKTHGAAAFAAGAGAVIRINGRYRRA